MLGHWSLSFSIHLAVAGLVFTSRFFRNQEKGDNRKKEK